MTFKHLKFSESSTMRAFEKMAQQKGLVKAEAVQKTAKKSLDLVPSDNLLENILKLTTGLKAQGFNKYANELEKKYFIFREAESLYETSKETGEDLVDQAHPKGSHKLDDVDHTVLTIVDQKKKIEDIVNKKPTGKFASNNEIIGAVKIVLGQDVEEKASQYFIGLINEATGVLNNIIRNEDLSDFTHHDPGWTGADEETTGWISVRTTKGHFENVRDYLNELSRKPINAELIKTFKKYLNTIVTLITKADNISADRKTKYSGSIRIIYSKADRALNILRGEDATEQVKKVEVPVAASKKVEVAYSDFSKEIEKYIERAKAMGIKDIDPNIKWLQKALLATNDTLTEYNNFKFKDDEKIIAEYMKKLDSFKLKVDSLVSAKGWK